MEQKSIGSFIAALRKANGLTQKQLAEQLNISDKAVSRWERGESLPDLTMIPVLAEIFDVTSDELLRGQRQSTLSTPVSSANERVSKQKKHLLNMRKTKYTTGSMISAGISILGLIAAMICNLVFLRAYLGFLIACIFFTAAAICQLIFINLNLCGLDEDTLSTKELTKHRSHTFHLASIVFLVIATLIGISFPLITLPPDAYFGLEISSWAASGALCGITALVVCFIVITTTKLLLGRKGLLATSENKLALYKLRLQFTGILAAALTVLVILQALLNSILPPLFLSGTTLQSWDSFKAIMETPKRSNYYEYYDDGNMSIYPGYSVEQIYDSDGTLLCEFNHKNQTIQSWEWKRDDDGPIITVYTDEDYSNANLIMDDLVNLVYVILYPAAIIVIGILYCKRAKTYRH